MSRYVSGGSEHDNGNQLTISLPLTFKAAFGGAKTVYALAIDTASLNDGWWTEGMLERALVVSRKGLRLMAERPKAASGIHSPGG